MQTKIDKLIKSFMKNDDNFIKYEESDRSHSFEFKDMIYSETLKEIISEKLSFFILSIPNNKIALHIHKNKNYESK